MDGMKNKSHTPIIEAQKLNFFHLREIYRFKKESKKESQFPLLRLPWCALTQQSV
jgi:hypothetical protein